MSPTLWQSAASPEVLQARARLNQQIRAFFQARQVLEVETPLLSHAIGTDPNLHPVTALYQPFPHAETTSMYLQTSPEFAMKRLLASGSGPIFQLCKAFRNGESGRRHNPEFTMLEWYRPGFSFTDLMDEVEALVSDVLGTGVCTRSSYRNLFQHYLGIDPHAASVELLRELAAGHMELSLGQVSLGQVSLEQVRREEVRRDTWLELLYSHVIEPQLKAPVFIYDYPASQAALACVIRDAEGVPVAQRFELVIAGMELANGYLELVDAAEQQRRFAADQQQRLEQGLPRYPVDERLVAALQHGLPACAGVALGVDRLLMLQLGAASIADVLAFPHPQA